MMLMKTTAHRWLKAAAAAVAAAALLTGCSGAGGGSATGQGGEAAISDKAPESMTVAYPGQVASLDPLLGYGLQDINIIALFGEGLYEFRYGHDSDPQPGLAEKAETSADGLTWTFTLRDGLTFSDGTPLTSADVKATLDRARDFVGNAWASFAAPLAQIDAPDPVTVVVHVSRPYPNLPTVLAESGFAVFPAAAYSQGDAYWTKPISAGPYMLKDAWDGGTEITIVENPNYWGPKPVIGEINFTTIVDFNTAVAQLRTGQIDMAQGLPMSVQPDLAKAEGIEWNLVQTYGFTGFPMNNAKAPFDDPNVRKAVSLAMDRDQMNKVVWRGLAEPISSFWPTTMEGYDKSISTDQNLEEAKELLKGTACENGCTVELAYNSGNGAWASQLSQVAATDLAKIGITANVTEYNIAQFVKHVIEEPDYDIAVTYIYDFANIPEGMLEYNATQGSYFNSFYSGWQNPELQDAVEAALTADESGRAAALAEIDRLHQEDMPFVTVATYNDLWAQRVSSKFVSAERTDQIAVAREE
jgi:peptide/nickel transport system substrate-binding protein